MFAREKFARLLNSAMFAHLKNRENIWFFEISFVCCFSLEHASLMFPARVCACERYGRFRRSFKQLVLTVDSVYVVKILCI